MVIHGITFPSNDYYTTDGITTPSASLFDNFMVPLSGFLRRNIDQHSDTLPHIDFQHVKTEIVRLLATLSADEEKELRLLKVAGKPATKRQWQGARARVALMNFLWLYPHYANLIMNFHLYAPISVRAAEIFLNDNISTENFVQAKAYIDQINRQKWNRPQSPEERQSGVSNLGGISELLLEKALSELIDSRNFFKTNDPKIKTYGDFILMCLPNNLWVSVKSNFARERLLASGYTTDILGVGFFTDKNEFVSNSKIRNFQRVGFLCMYLPDIPITDDQIGGGISTYQEVIDHFGGQENLPLNINGTPFIRSLSMLHTDLSHLLDISELANRTTIDF